MAYIRVKVLLGTHQLPGCHQHIVIKNNFDTCTFLLFNLYAHHNRMLGIPPTYIYRPTLCCTATYTRCQAGQGGGQRHIFSLKHTPHRAIYIYSHQSSQQYSLLLILPILLVACPRSLPGLVRRRRFYHPPHSSAHLVAAITHHR